MLGFGSRANLKERAERRKHSRTQTLENPLYNRLTFLDCAALSYHLRWEQVSRQTVAELRGCVLPPVER